jgi:hypothetical protein
MFSRTIRRLQILKQRPTSFDAHVDVVGLNGNQVLLFPLSDLNQGSQNLDLSA